MRLPCRQGSARSFVMADVDRTLRRSRTELQKPLCLSSSPTTRNEPRAFAIAQAGLGQMTVRAQIHAITSPASHQAGSPLGINHRCVSRLGRASTGRSGVCPPRTFGARPWMSQLDLSHLRRYWRTSGKLRGISMSALLISTATGLRSEARADSPRRWRFQRDSAAAGEWIEDRWRCPAS